MSINVAAMMSTLPVMLYGMAGIFVVSVVIYLCILAIIKIFPAKD